MHVILYLIFCADLDDVEHWLVQYVHEANRRHPLIEGLIPFDPEGDSPYYMATAYQYVLLALEASSIMVS